MTSHPLCRHPGQAQRRAGAYSFPERWRDTPTHTHAQPVVPVSAQPKTGIK